MSKLTKALTAAAGNAGGGTLGYVEDVFSTYLYEGNGATQTITNDIDLDGEGGMVWIKCRSYAINNAIQDTLRGGSNILFTNTTAANQAYSTSITSFNSDGFSLGSETLTNFNNQTFASWTFRKAEKFFDVVTYSGNGVAGREIAHSLGDTPGMIIIKATNSAQNWVVWHNSLSASNKELYLNLTISEQTGAAFNSTAPTSSVFTVGNNALCNLSGVNYVAYLFASDAGGFGDDGSESIIKCGSYTGNSAGVEINLGFEPQWVMVKPSSTDGNWDMSDVMRGATAEKTATFDGNWAELTANTSTAEISRDATITPRPTGMFIKDNGLSNNGETYIYIAIRRPMKTPESGTEVFSPVAYSGNSTAGRSITSGFPLDAVFTKGRNAAIEPILYSRLQGSAKKLLTYSNAVEASSSTNVITSFDQDGMTVGTDADINNSSYTYVNYFFKRATGFFDVVAYTGDGTSNRSINHNLGVTPEFIIGKIRSGQTDFWGVWQASLGNQGMYLSATNSAGTTLVAEGHTSSIFKVSNGYGINNVSTLPHIAYLFGSVAGVSKVGSYTGTGSNVDVDCGFSAGARFILIKRTDSTGDWYVYDSVRGIVAGNDPYLLLNSTAAEVTSTDYIDPLASGFTVTSSAPAALNASGGSYIFLAIA